MYFPTMPIRNKCFGSFSLLTTSSHSSSGGSGASKPRALTTSSSVPSRCNMCGNS